MGNPSFVLCACSLCFARSHVGCGVDTPVALYVLGGAIVWEVEGEGLYMRSGGGGTVDGKWRGRGSRWEVEGEGLYMGHGGRACRWEVEGEGL